MNLMHLRYAVEVEKTRSISKAAQELYMGQPNLSRAIKDLEESLGITIFSRTSKGITPTVQGERFLAYAKSILAQIDEVESLYKRERENKLKFSISVPRASYISAAFARFAAEIDGEKELELRYKETNAMRAVDNILKEGYNLAIIRYQTAFEKNFQIMLGEKDLRAQTIWEFERPALMSRRHPLANAERIREEELAKYTEIAHADPYVPSMPAADVQKAELPDDVGRRIFVYERASQFELLASTPGAYVRVSPVPQDIIRRFDLVQRRCEDGGKLYRDVLVCRSNYKFTDMDEEYLRQLEAVRGEVESIPVV